MINLHNASNLHTTIETSQRTICAQSCFEIQHRTYQKFNCIISQILDLFYSLLFWLFRFGIVVFFFC